MSCSRADDVAWHGAVWRGEGSRGARRCAAKTPVGCDPTGKSSTEKRAVARQVAKGARVRGQRRQSHTPYPIPPSGGCGQPRAAASVEHASARRSASQTTYLCDVYLRAHAGDAHVGGIGRHAHAADAAQNGTCGASRLEGTDGQRRRRARSATGAAVHVAHWRLCGGCAQVCTPCGLEGGEAAGAVKRAGGALLATRTAQRANERARGVRRTGGEGPKPLGTRRPVK